MTQEEQYMAQALALAEEAAATGDIPVGCVVVKDGVIIGQGRNRRERPVTPPPTPRWRPSGTPAPPWAAGGWRGAICT